jgi:hypothetical protein
VLRQSTERFRQIAQYQKTEVQREHIGVIEGKMWGRRGQEMGRTVIEGEGRGAGKGRRTKFMD